MLILLTWTETEARWWLSAASRGSGFLQQQQHSLSLLCVVLRTLSRACPSGSSHNYVSALIPGVILFMIKRVIVISVI